MEERRPEHGRWQPLWEARWEACRRGRLWKEVELAKASHLDSQAWSPKHPAKLVQKKPDRKTTLCDSICTE